MPHRQFGPLTPDVGRFDQRSARALDFVEEVRRGDRIVLVVPLERFDQFLPGLEP